LENFLNRESAAERVRMKKILSALEREFGYLIDNRFCEFYPGSLAT